LVIGKSDNSYKNKNQFLLDQSEVISGWIFEFAKNDVDIPKDLKSLSLGTFEVLDRQNPSRLDQARDESLI